VVYHILNGDSLAEKFPHELEGDRIILREAFMDGPATEDFSEAYWRKRQEYISGTYGVKEDEYALRFGSQKLLLDGITSDDEVWLWFEDDLFCVVNMWFVIAYLTQKVDPKLYRVFPVADDRRWLGFANADKGELINHFSEARKFTADDILLSQRLWHAFVENEREGLSVMSFSDSGTYRFLPEVIKAHLDRSPPDGLMGRPQRVLSLILQRANLDFDEIIREFWKSEGIYGYADTQIRNILREMNG
jgi:hypothetical protein